MKKSIAIYILLITTALHSGDILNISGSVADRDMVYYKVHANASEKLTINLTNIKGDPDVYVKVGERPTTNDYDQSSENSPNVNENIEITPDEENDVYIGIYGYVNGYLNADYTLAVSSPEPQLVTDGKVILGHVNYHQMNYYRIIGKAGDKIEILLNNTTNDPDLYLRTDKKPTIQNYDVISDNSPNLDEKATITLVKDQDLYIGVYGYNGYPNATYTLKVKIDRSDKKVYAFYADEHNTADGVGNRILQIDIENMTLEQELAVPGNLGHHADNTYNSKIYGVPKGSNYVNVIELRKDKNGKASMKLKKKIPLIHKPRSGDAYNGKYNIVLMAAKNRPMGSFIDVGTDTVIGTIGENVDCTLTDGTKLLSHNDANTADGAMKYQCANLDHGGDQISGHPYWLTTNIVAIVDRSNRQISTYKIWKDGSKIKSRLLNHLKTRSSIHQIVPRDRDALPASQQNDFYAVEEGNIGNDTRYGIPEALIKLELTVNGLKLIQRMDLQRSQPTSRVKSDRVLQGCKDIYFKDRSILYPPSILFGQPKGIWTFDSRRDAYKDLFLKEGIIQSNTSQSEFNDFPIECLHAGIPGGHNGDFAADNKHLFIGMAGGMMSVIDVDKMHLVNNVDAGARSGPGHTCFSKKHNIAMVTNHKGTHIRIVGFYDRAGIEGRPTDGGRITLENFGILKQGITNTYQSHTCYIDEAEDYYYNFFTDGGVFYKIDLSRVSDWAYGRSQNRDFVIDSLYTDGIPIQGSFIKNINIR